MKHPYSPFTLEIEDDVTHERNLSLLKKELMQVKSKTDTVRDLMRRTFKSDIIKIQMWK